MELVCPERQAALAATVRRLTAYSWTVPQVESNTVRGQDRVVVVSVSASGRRGAASGRLRVLVRGGSGGAEVCGLAAA